MVSPIQSGTFGDRLKGGSYADQFNAAESYFNNYGDPTALRRFISEIQKELREELNDLRNAKSKPKSSKPAKAPTKSSESFEPWDMSKGADALPPLDPSMFADYQSESDPESDLPPDLPESSELPVQSSKKKPKLGGVVTGAIPEYETLFEFPEGGPEGKGSCGQDLSDKEFTMSSFLTSKLGNAVGMAGGAALGGAIGGPAGAALGAVAGDEVGEDLEESLTSSFISRYDLSDPLTYVRLCQSLEEQSLCDEETQKSIRGKETPDSARGSCDGYGGQISFGGEHLDGQPNADIPSSADPVTGDVGEDLTDDPESEQELMSSLHRLFSSMEGRVDFEDNAVKSILRKYRAGLINRDAVLFQIGELLQEPYQLENDDEIEAIRTEEGVYDDFSDDLLDDGSYKADSAFYDN